MNARRSGPGVRRQAVLGFAAWLPLVACGGAPERNGPGAGASARSVGPCPAEGAALTPQATFAGREGLYRLTLVADSPGTPPSGAAGAGSVVATLTLEPTSQDRRAVVVAGGEPVAGVTAPLYGWTDLEPGALGAVAPGDVSSRDPARPGVLVLEDRTRGDEEGPGIVLRLGDHANDRTRTTFDQAFLALRVEWLEADGAFGGSWSSGGRGARAGVRGTFCAAPTSE